MMTSGTEDGATSTGATEDGGDITLSSVDRDRTTSRSRRWWFVAALIVLAVGMVAWLQSAGDEPTALVTVTDPRPSDSVAPTSTDPISTTTTTPSSTGTTPLTSTPAAIDDAPSTTSTMVERPVVPASTSSATTTTGAATTSIVATTPATIVVSGSADPTAPQVSLVDDAVTEAIVIDPVPNTSLDGADRTPIAVTSTTTKPPLACAAAPTRLDADALVATDAIRAEHPDGTAATMVATDLGLGVVGGRDAQRLDYAAQRGASERLFIDLGAPRCGVDIELGDFDVAEWNGVDEALHWVGLDGDNRTVGEGYARAGADRPITLDLVTPIEGLLLEAAPYGATGDGWPAGADRVDDDNSDFVLIAIIVR